MITREHTLSYPACRAARSARRSTDSPALDATGVQFPVVDSCCAFMNSHRLECRTARDGEAGEGAALMGTMISGFIVILIGGFAAFSYPVIQVNALRRMLGVWRVLAAVPLLPMGYILVVTALALGKGSNLWPILLIFTAPLGAAYLWILRWAHTRIASPPKP